MSDGAIAASPQSRTVVGQGAPISLGLTWIITAATFAGSFSPRLMTISQPVFVAVYAAALAVAGTAAINQRIVNQDIKHIGWWSLLFTLWFIPVFLQEHHYVGWIFGDLAQYSAPFLLYFVARAYPNIFGRDNAIIYIGMLIFGAIIATQFVHVSEDGRFQPPRPILYGFAWWVAIHYRGLSWRRVCAWILVVILIVLAWTSTVRAAVVLWLLCGALIFLTRMRVRTGWIYLAAGTLLSAVILGGLLAKGISASRFSQIDFSNLGDSEFIAERGVEVLDAWKYFSERMTPVQVVFGYGPGGTFRVSKLFATLQLHSLENGRVNSDGFDHIIHFGPMRLLFRWGLTGLFGYIFFGYLLFRDWWVVWRYGRYLREDYLFPAFYFGAMGMYLRYMLQPMENEWDFAYMLVGYLILRQHYIPRLRMSSASPSGDALGRVGSEIQSA